MNKKVLIVLIIIIILIVLALLYFFLKPKKSDTEKAPKNYHVVLDINAGIPFKWEYKIDDESILKLKEKVVKAEETKEPISGGLMHEYYTFEGLKEGETRVTFSFVNITDNTSDETREYKAVVDKDLKVTVTENN